MSRVLGAAGAVLVGLSLWFSYGAFDPWALAFVSLGAAAALAATVSGEAWTASGERAARAVLGVGVAISLATTLLFIPGDRRAPQQHPAVLWLAAVALAVVMSYAVPRPPRWLLRARFPVLLLVAAAMLTAAVLHAGPPFIDVWVFRQMGSQGLAHGQDPYALLFPNIYRDGRFYGPGVLDGGKVTVYPYPPLSAAVDLPFYLALGDVRWASVALMLLAAGLLARLSRGPLAELAAAFVLFQPRTLYVAEASWTEPLVLAAWVGALQLVRRWRSRAPDGWALAGLGVGLLLAAKQYAPILVAPLALAAPKEHRGRAALLALAVVAVTFLPFALWNPGELWRDVVVAQLAQPFRKDALSWLAAWARWCGTEQSAALGFVAGAAVLASCGVGRRSLRRCAATAGAAFVFLVLFNKQAFCNYYWLAVGVLASACVLEPAPADGAGLGAGPARRALTGPG